MLRYALGLSLALVPMAAQAQKDDRPPVSSPARPDMKGDTDMDKDYDKGVDKKSETGAGSSKGDPNAMPAAMPDKVAPSAAGQQAALDDAEILSRLHHVNQLEVDAGKLAAQKGQLAQVKSYGQMMQKDHAKADQELTDFAKKNNIALHEPKALNADDQKMLDEQNQLGQKLGALTGADFDREYANAMLQGHSDVITMLEQSRSSAKASVKAFYDKLLPALRHHRDAAADIVAGIQVQANPTGTSGTGTSDDAMGKGTDVHGLGNSSGNSGHENAGKGTDEDKDNEQKSNGKAGDIGHP
jgi:putative membrane protein